MKVVGENALEKLIKLIKEKFDTKANKEHTHDAATTSANGFMSSTDKIKLDGIQANATAVAFTQSATSGNKVGSITINGTSADMYSPTQTSVTGNAGTATKWQTARISTPCLSKGYVKRL